MEQNMKVSGKMIYSMDLVLNHGKFTSNYNNKKIIIIFLYLYTFILGQMVQNMKEIMFMEKNKEKVNKYTYFIL